MAKVFLICGKICSGKTHYARALREKHNAVILSTDEATFDLIRNEQGEFYNVFADRVNGYLQKKAEEICKAGANVILDWGFWTRQSRKDMSEFLRSHGVEFEWHYMDVDDDTWERNIRRRNAGVLKGNGGCDFFVDEGLRKKVLSLFEAPDKDETDVWVHS